MSGRSGPSTVRVFSLAFLFGIMLCFGSPKNPASRGAVESTPESSDADSTTETPLGEESGDIEQVTASGTIQAQAIRISSEIGGRILEISAREGSQVSAGDHLVGLDSSSVLIQLATAEAAIATAVADLKVAEAEPRLEEIAILQAIRELSRADRDAAFSIWQNLLLEIDNPQQLDGQIAQARTQLDLAEQGVELGEAELAAEMLLRDQQPPESTQRTIADLQVRASEAALAAARADEESARRLLSWLWIIRQEPLALTAQANAARGAYEVAEAGTAVAQARLDDLLAGPLPEEGAVARALVQQLEAEADILRVKQDLLVLASPIDGIVTQQDLYLGELAAPAATILSVADLSHVDLLVYVPENLIGLVSLDGIVHVTVDSYPTRTFDGTVTHIRDEPEFTPRNVVTTEERLNTFYGVSVRLPNPDYLLKPGMPADAVFLIERSSPPS